MKKKLIKVLFFFIIIGTIGIAVFSLIKGKILIGVYFAIVATLQTILYHYIQKEPSEEEDFI